jgi:hypothetical protein
MLERMSTALRTLSPNLEDLDYPKTIETTLPNRAYKLPNRSLAMLGRLKLLWWKSATSRPMPWSNLGQARHTLYYRCWMSKSGIELVHKTLGI